MSSLLHEGTEYVRNVLHQVLLIIRLTINSEKLSHDVPNVGTGAPSNPITDSGRTPRATQLKFFPFNHRWLYYFGVAKTIRNRIKNRTGRRSCAKELELVLMVDNSMKRCGYKKEQLSQVLKGDDGIVWSGRVKMTHA